MSGTTIPIVLTDAGRTTQSPATLNALVISTVNTLNPGYTVLPAGLIEDISSTITAAVYICDQYVTELINSITPYGANEFLLTQLGAIYGAIQGESTNNSAYVVFEGTAGYVVGVGFTVSDGTYDYTVQEGFIMPASGVSGLIYVVATQSGAWPMLANTITEIVTSLPTDITLTVTNPNPGTQSEGAQTVEAYRAQVLQTGLAPAQGMTTYLKSLLANIPGVQTRLVRVLQVSSTAWEVIVGGGDPYAIANAIFNSVFAINQLVGSTTTDRNVTVSIYDYPDTYSIVFVVPPSQAVIVALTWNTTSSNFVADDALAQDGVPAIVDYINSIPVGQPINLFEMQNAFQEATAAILPTTLLTRMVFTVSINGTVVSPESGTGIYASDPESYFLTSSTAVSVTRG